MERIDRDKILRLWSLIVYIKGKSKYNKGVPDLIVLGGSKTKRSKLETFGEYYYTDNIIKIWCGPHIDFEDLASTILHEYTHYLQFWPWYTRYRNMYKYDENPYEIEAKNSENLATDLVKMVSESVWRKFVRSNRKVLRIYERSQEIVNVKY